MRIIRTIAPCTLFLFFTYSWACAQGAAPSFEVFAEGGGSFLNGGSDQMSVPMYCAYSPCPSGTLAATSSFSKTGRLFAGARLRFTRHDAFEASFSYSPYHLTLQGTEFFPDTALVQSGAGSAYNRGELISFNYVRYLWVKTRVQPFATAGLGTNRLSGPTSAVGALASLVKAGNAYQFAGNYGGGADLVLQRHLALRLELRDYVTGQPSVITGTSHNIVPSAGIVFRLG